ncbi:MAG: hypothetical protein HQM02_04810 [Magnetococcales bacterium]|nr:hypothetical protein [Magnetococcales bacterium]
MVGATRCKRRPLQNDQGGKVFGYPKAGIPLGQEISKKWDRSEADHEKIETIIGSFSHGRKVA